MEKSSILKIILQLNAPFNVLPSPNHTLPYSFFPLVKAMLEVFYCKNI